MQNGRRPINHGQPATINVRRATRDSGFTLVEMLTVIGIIVLLVSILLPVVSSVRTKGHVADTQAMLARIATGIESYYSDYKAYPGPLHNGQIFAGGLTPPAITVSNRPGGAATEAVTADKITQSENLAIGLLGGMRPVVSGSGAVTSFTFDWNQMGGGPMSLNPRAPKKGRAYMDKVSLSDGDYRDESGDADDSILPEFLDKFPSPMPILYMRANVGKSGIVTDKLAIGDQEQYDLKQIQAYTLSEPGRTIGEGREAPSDEDLRPRPAPGTPNSEKIKHGLRQVRTTATLIDPPPPTPPGLQYFYPYDLYAFMRHPSMANTPRQKDSYILISAGADRIYGTRDDAVYPAVR